MIKYESPLVDDIEITKLQEVLPEGFKSCTLETVFDPSQDDVRGKNLSDALDRLSVQQTIISKRAQIF